MKPGHTIDIREIEIAQLDLRYANSRIYKKEGISSLVHSIECHGQIIPVITMGQRQDYVLIGEKQWAPSLSHVSLHLAQEKGPP